MHLSASVVHEVFIRRDAEVLNPQDTAPFHRGGPMVGDRIKADNSAAGLHLSDDQQKQQLCRL